MIVGINGFGRIGRNAARVILNTQGATLGAINSMSSFESHAYLLAHDSTQGAFDKKLDGVKIVNEKEPEKIPWGEVDVVLECTGKFRTTDEASKHSVKKVVISACTTNCVTTVLKVLHDDFGVIRGNMTTIHAVTDSQNLLDNSHKKEVRLRRSALVNMIPTSSGSVKDVAKLFPHLKDKLPCRAIRVPLATVSLIDLVVAVKKKTSKEEVNRVFEKAEKTSLAGILSVANEELVSSDFVGD